MPVADLMPHGCHCEPALAPALAKRGERGGSEATPAYPTGAGEAIPRVIPEKENALSIAKGSFAMTAGVFFSSLLGKIRPNILLECAKEYIGAGEPFEDAASGLKAIHPGSKLPHPTGGGFPMPHLEGAPLPIHIYNNPILKDPAIFGFHPPGPFLPLLSLRFRSS
jgi:hypothetical protein